ncbi:MAG: hypothetical protein ABF295_05140 [Flavobacteriaceae bacterium]
MRNLSKLIFLLLIISCNSSPKSKEEVKAFNDSIPVNGFYEYLSSNGHRNQYLLIDTLKNKHYGIYYKTQPKRGKGQWYYAHSLSKFRIDNDSVRFVLGERKAIGNKAVAPSKISGRIPDQPSDKKKGLLHFKGKINGNSLEMHCQSEKGDCPDQLMYFKKIPLPE